MKIQQRSTSLRLNAVLVSLALAAALVPAQAQTTATWTGGSLNGLWNTAGNWDIGIPAEGTNAVIKNGNTVNYNTPMAATAIAGLTLGSAQGGVLNVNASGFTIDAGGAVPLTIGTNGFLRVNSGGVVVVTNSGAVTMQTPTTGVKPVVDVEGGSLILTNSGSFFMGESANSDNNIGAIFTNNGGTVFVGQQFRVKGRDSRFYMSAGQLDVLGGLSLNVTGNDYRQFFSIAGGTANLGDVTIDRATTAGGLSVEGGVVNSSSIRIGINIASGNSRMTGGIWTNAGAFYIGDRANPATGSRRVYFTMSGGALTTLGTDGIVINNQGQTTLSSPTDDGGTLAVTGGTITTEGIYLNGPLVTANAYARFQLSAGTVYLGALGLVANADSGNSLTAEFTLSGGTLAAKDAWISSANLPLTGNLTLKTADASDAAHNISLNGILSGSGGITKTGNGVLTLGAANTYSGPTIISAGTLALDVSGSLLSSLITVRSNVTYDVSLAAGGGSVLGSGQTINGLGTVVGLTAGSGSHISPADATTQGTLNFTSGLTLTAANIDMELTDDLTGVTKTNDFINITGDLSLNGSTVINVTPIGSLGTGTYTLMHFSGNLNGNISNLSCAAGMLTNPPGSHAIQLVVAYVRPVGNLVWRGDGSANIWNTTGASNWLNGAVYDSFYTGDNVTLDDTATNFTVNLSGTVAPAATGVVWVNATSNYTIADVGSGVIHGLTGLTKTNTGTLSITAANNDYTGVTTVKGGVLEASVLANGGVASSIGAAPNVSSSLVISNGTFRYVGSAVTIDRGARLDSTNSVIDVSATGSLTLGGLLNGEGSLTKTGNGNLVLNDSGNAYVSGTVVQAGTLTVNAVGALGTNQVNLAGGTLAIGPVKPANVINVVAPSTVSGGDSGGLSGIKAVIGSSDLVISISGGSTFDLTGDMTTYSGNLTFNNAGGQFARFNGTTGSALATWDLGAGPMDLNIRNSSTLNSFGALKGAPGTTLSGRGGASNNGPTTHVIGDKGLSTTFDGIIQDGSGGSSAKTSIIKNGSGVLTLTAANTYSGTTTISNGVLALAIGAGGEGAIDSSSNIRITAGSFLDVSGRSSTSLALGGSQTLQGRGTILGGLDASGIVAPGGGTGGDIGTLTVTNTVNLYGTAWMKLNRASSPNSDRLVSSTAGIINYGGALVLTNTGARLQAGDTFTLFSAVARNNSFTLVLPNYYTWDTSQLNASGQVSVTSVLPPPGITNVDFSQLSAGSIIINANNGAPNGPVNILTSTNLTLPVSSWTTVTTSTFDGSGNLSLPITVDPTLPQSFYLLQVY